MSSTYNPVFIQTGIVNGTTPIMADIGSRGLSGTYMGAVEVTINPGYTYTYTNPEWIVPPFLDGSETPYHPGLSYGPGSVLKLLQPEAAALVAAGAATINAYL